MTLPLTIRASGPNGEIERQGQTRDVSFRGLYFLIDADFEAGSSIELVLTLPREITLAGDVHIRCFAEIIRVEPHDGMPELFFAVRRRQLEQLALGIDDDAIALIAQ